MPRTRRRPPPPSTPKWVPSPGSGYVRSWPFCATQWSTPICAGWVSRMPCVARPNWASGSRCSSTPTGTGAQPPVATIVVVQLVPCIVLGPFLGAWPTYATPSSCWSSGSSPRSSRWVASPRPSHGGTGVGRLHVGPTPTLSITLTRPTQAALFPAVVRTPEELTAANVMSGWTYGVACLVGPALAGVLVVGGGDGVGRRWQCGVRGLALVPGVRLHPLRDHASSNSDTAAERSLRLRRRGVAGPRPVPSGTADQSPCRGFGPRRPGPLESSRLLLRAAGHDRPALRRARHVLPPHGLRRRRLPECRRRGRGGRRRVRHGLSHRATPAEGPAGRHLGPGRRRPSP